jgi:rhomboid family GlyGly-CTERM serine protease
VADLPERRIDWPAARPGLALLAFCLLPLLLSEAAIARLEYRRDAVLAGEIWRLWSGHCVHFTAAHAMLDGLACMILATGLQLAGQSRRLLPRLVVIAPLLTLTLLIAVPEMAIYRGASGVAMALLAATWLTLWQYQQRWRPWLWPPALVLLLKLMADALDLNAFSASLPAEIEVAWQIHLAGLVSGLVFWRRVGCIPSISQRHAD